MSLLKKTYEVFPLTLKKVARALYRVREHIPLTEMSERNRWIRDVYTGFAIEQRRHVLMSIARYCIINRPINGYYFEFGCHSATTMRLAYDCFHRLFDWRYVGFDSFEGLPDISDIDKQEIWQKGKLKTDEEEFVRLVVGHGMPRDKLITVKGFYNHSLTAKLKQRLLPDKAAVIYIDCDLYESTVPVLNFIKNFLQRGTIIVFDDWNCFYGDPERGERRAFREFQEREPGVIFEDFVQTGEIKSFICLGEKESGRG